MRPPPSKICEVPIVGFVLRRGMGDEEPYCSPPKLYVISLKTVVGAIKERFDKGGPDELTKLEFTFPTSVCNKLVAIIMSMSKGHSKSLFSAIVDSPWCRLTKLHIKYSRDELDWWPLTTLFNYSLTELIIECDTVDCKTINLTEIGRPLGNNLVSLTLQNCKIDYKNFEHGLYCFVKLVHLTMQCVSFCGVQCRQNKILIPVLPCLEVLDLSLASLHAIENIFLVQKHVKVLQLYNVPVEMNMFSLLINLVVLDISKKIHDTNLSSLNESALMASLSKMPSLRSLDVSCRQISDADVSLFDQPHHRMTFLGLFNITLCNHQSINADQVNYTPIW